MLFQTIEYGFFRESILLFRYFAVFLLFNMAFQTGKKIKEAKLLSATTGFTIFFITFGLCHLFHTFLFFYANPPLDVIFYLAASLTLLTGMISFIFLFEIDCKLHNPDQDKKKFSYYLTAISLLIAIVLFPTFFFILGDVAIVFLFIVVPFIIAILFFISKFQSLEIVKRSKSLLWIFLGLTLAGFSTFLIAPIFQPTLGNWALFLNSLSVIVGCLMMTWGWHRIPRLSELDWLRKMERLLLIHLESSGLMYQYNFQSSNRTDLEHQVEGDLAGTAIGGVDMLLGEILASNGHIKEIDHGNKKIIFTHGVKTACILITTGHSDEFRYRLEMFHSSFEKQFGKYLKIWSGEVTRFKKVKELILRFFF